jgi:hypothetical protein
MLHRFFSAPPISAHFGKFCDRALFKTPKRWKAFLRHLSVEGVFKTPKRWKAFLSDIASFFYKMR